MRWQTGRQSTNVEDRRGRGGPIGLGLGGLLLVIILAVVFKKDPRALLSQLNVQTGGGGGMSAPAGPEQERLKEFASAVLADTEDVWSDQFRQMGRDYPEPTLVLFNGRVESACGLASAAVGPFYCPGDQKVYLDLSFFNELAKRYESPGDFAQAYVIAHEIGHHVQNQLGIMEKVNSMRGRISEEEYNALSVRLELQADYLAGMWAHHAQKM
ncbi:MAG TPA: neutral zinc metallopeptidase, partial [Phycisphaerales bacterium]|nr:neutral zinc metallopeptidase [Phycisphaerales bacterium]